MRGTQAFLTPISLPFTFSLLMPLLRSSRLPPDIRPPPDILFCAIAFHHYAPSDCLVSLPSGRAGLFLLPQTAIGEAREVDALGGRRTARPAGLLREALG